MSERAPTSSGYDHNSNVDMITRYATNKIDALLRTAKNILRFSRAPVRQRIDPEDLVQETLTTMLKTYSRKEARTLIENEFLKLADGVMRHLLVDLTREVYGRRDSRYKTHRGKSLPINATDFSHFHSKEEDFLESQPDPSLGPEELATARAALDFVKERVGETPAMVLDERFFGRKKFREIGKEMGFSESRACQLETLALERLRKAMDPSITSIRNRIAWESLQKRSR